MGVDGGGVRIGGGVRPDAGERGVIGFCGLAVGDLVDAAAGAVDAGVLVAFAGVGPVEDVDGAVGAGADVDAAEQRVGGEEERRARAWRRSRCRGVRGSFDVGAAAVLVQGEEFAVPVFVGPVGRPGRSSCRCAQWPPPKSLAAPSRDLRPAPFRVSKWKWSAWLVDAFVDVRVGVDWPELRFEVGAGDACARGGR